MESFFYINVVIVCVWRKEKDQYYCKRTNSPASMSLSKNKISYHISYILQHQNKENKTLSAVLKIMCITFLKAIIGESV